MKPEEVKVVEETREFLERLDNVIRHIENVKSNCYILGKKLIQAGEKDLGRQLIANSYVHDNSKFHGIEWKYLDDDGYKARKELAISQHNTSPTNKHHPEAWGSEEAIEEMPRLFLAEMVADWKSRANEFGTDLRDWVEVGAATRFGYKKGDKVYRQIMEFVDMLCDKPFKQK